MKTMTTMTWAAALVLAAAVAASAQGPGGGGRGARGGGQGGGAGGGPQGGGPRGGDAAQPGGNFQVPDADQIVKRMLADFDADKDGKLDAAELKKSIEARRPQRPGPGGQQGGPEGRPGPGGGPGGAGFAPGGGRSGPPGEGAGFGRGGGPGGGPGGAGGFGGPRGEPPAPEKVAESWMGQFDADKNGSLNGEELQKALSARRPMGPPPGGPQEFDPPPDE
jgi:hypothetical protein